MVKTALILFASVVLACGQIFVPGGENLASGKRKDGPASYTLAYGAELVTYGSNADATNYATTGTFSIAANTLAILAVSTAVASGTALYPNTITGHGVTWNLIGKTNYNGVANCIAVYWAITNAATQTAAATVNYGWGNTQGGVNIWACSFTGAHLTTPIVQSVVMTNTANVAITLSAITGTKNGVMSINGELDTNGSWGTPEAGWSEIDNIGHNNPTDGMYVTYRVPTTDNTVAVTGTGSTGAVAFEIGVRQ